MNKRQRKKHNQARACLGIKMSSGVDAEQELDTLIEIGESLNLNFYGVLNTSGVFNCVVFEDNNPFNIRGTLTEFTRKLAKRTRIDFVRGYTLGVNPRNYKYTDGRLFLFDATDFVTDVKEELDA